MSIWSWLNTGAWVACSVILGWLMYDFISIELSKIKEHEAN